MKVLIATVLTLISVAAFACQFDTDCGVGSSCLKEDSNVYGVCVGGMQPGNQHDRKPVVNTLNAGDKVGATCSFDTQCGLSRKCFKSAGNLYGTCM